MFRRIEEGTTTYRDVYLLMGFLLLAFFLGVGLGWLLH